MSRAFTNSFANSLYQSPVQASGTPSRTTVQPEKAASTPVLSQTTPTSHFPSPLPQTSTSAQNTPTGRWSHPAVSKVSEVQKERAPNDTTIRKVLLNAFAIVLLFKLAPYLTSLTLLNDNFTHRYLTWFLYALGVLLAYNIAENLRRFWWKNTFDEYPLTPSQRKLLNLPASPVAVVSGSTAITPPRYQKSYTPSPTAPSPLSSGVGRRSSLSSYSPSAGVRARDGDSVQLLGRSSPLQPRSTNRSVSLIDNSYSPTDFRTSTYGSPLSLSSAAGGKTSSRSSLQGSTRFKYTHNE